MKVLDETKLPRLLEDLLKRLMRTVTWLFLNVIENIDGKKQFKCGFYAPLQYKRNVIDGTVQIFLGAQLHGKYTMKQG